MDVLSLVHVMMLSDRPQQAMNIAVSPCPFVEQPPLGTASRHTDCGRPIMTGSNGTASPDALKTKLLDQVRNCCRVRQMALKTEQTYCGWIRRFILFHGKRHPLEMGAKEVIEFL